MNMLKTKWMMIELKSPCVFASLTLLSSANLDSHLEYYKKIIDTNIGAIVLPSINPLNVDDSYICKSISDCVTLETGLDDNNKMGFSVLGPTSNIISLNYGVALVKKVCNVSKDVKIVGSVANIGNNYDIINAVKKLCKTNVDALELNFSCPNVITKNSSEKLTVNLLREIRSISNLPISLKITPYQDYADVLDEIYNEIDGITISNAYIGLIPPNINGSNISPFTRRKRWSPSGLYGPFEKNLTFYNLYKIISLTKD